MNWQKFIGISISVIGAIAIGRLTDDWTVIALAIIIGVGGVIYGDAD